MRLEHSGKVDDLRLVEEPAQVQALNEKMADKYGWANDFVGMMAGDRSKSLALRIDRSGTPGTGR